MLQFHDIIIKDTFHRLESRGEKWLHHSTFGMTHKEEQGENDQFILRLLLEQTGEQTPLLAASTTRLLVPLAARVTISPIDQICLKFMFPKKATKIEKNLQIDLTLT